MIDIPRSAASRGRLLVADPGDLGTLIQAAEGHQKLLMRLERAFQAGNQKKIVKCTRMILGSPESKLTAVVRTVFYDREAEPYGLAELLRRCRELNAYQPVKEAVGVYYKEKSAGGFRPVIAFGRMRRALQLLCADILRICLTAYPFDFMEKGNGGVDGAALRLGTIIKEGYYDFVVTVDIKNCFGSVLKEGVAELLQPLPGSVVRNVLLIQDDVETKVELRTEDGKPLNGCPIVLEQLPHEADTAARLGIPQGSSASNLVMSRAILGPVLHATSFADRLVLHGDDIAVAAKNKEEADLIYNTLRSLLESSGPAGPLTIGHHKTWCVNEYVNFCKYKLKRTAEMFGGEVRYSPSTRSLKRYDWKVERAFLNAPAGQELEKVEQFSAAWKKSFSRLWQPNEIAEDSIAIAEAMAVSAAMHKKSGIL